MPSYATCKVVQEDQIKLAKVELDVLGLETGDLLLVLIVDIG